MKRPRTRVSVRSPEALGCRGIWVFTKGKVDGPGPGKVNYGFGWAVHILPYEPDPTGSRLWGLY